MARKPTYEDLKQKVKELEEKVADNARAMEEVGKGKGFLTHVMESLPHPFLVIDVEDYSIHLANTSARQMSAGGEQEFCYALMHDCDAPCEEKEHTCPLKEVKRTGKPVRVEHTRLNQDGSPLRWAVRAYPVFDEDGRVEQVIYTALDITARKLAEEALAESEERYRLLTESMSDVIWISDKDLRFTYVSPSVERFIGYTPEELIGKTILDHLVPSYVETAAKKFIEMLAGEDSGTTASSKSREVEVQRVHKDGSIAWGEVTITLLRDEQGKITGALGVTRDITERKRAEKALQESEEKFRAIFDHAFQFIGLMSPDGTLLEANRSALEFARLKESAVIGKRFWETHWWEHSKELREQLRRAVAKAAGGDFARFEAFHPGVDGEIHFVDISITPVKNQAGQTVLLIPEGRDITERKRAEKQLLEERDKAQKYLDLAGVLFVVIDADQRIRLLNRKSCEVLGCKEEEVLGKNWFDIFLPERFRNDVEEGFKQLMAGDIEPMEYYENPVLTRSGQERIILWHNTALRDQDGRITATLSSGEDITDRKQAAQELWESEEKYRSILESANDGIGVVQDSYIKYTNPQLASMLGYEVEEIVNRTFPPLIWPEELSRVKNKYEKHISGEEKLQKYETALLHKNGMKIEVDLNSTLITYEGRPAGLVVLRDITERRQMEQKLQETQRIEALGVLAGGIAHDFNNILTAIMTNISVAKTWGDFDDEVSQVLTDAEAATLRAKDLSQQLLTFAKGGLPIKKPVSAMKMIENTTRFMLSGSNVRCDYDMPDDLWLLDADEGQIGQVLQNLILNADQAMPEGGVINIGAENVILEKDPLGTGGGRHVKLSIKDQGHGITDRQLSKIFDPFFTTKEKGRGLGLTTAFSIVHRHNGFIHVESEVGVGTTFHVHLPASEAAWPGIEKERKKVFKGSGRILLVDDEEIILRSAAKGLERLGYEVHVAKDGADGITVYEQATKENLPFDVVIMDLTIPGGMGGKEAIQELTKIDAGVKAIVSSGYSEDPVMSRFQDYGFCGVVKKPFTVGDLAEAIENVLDPVQE